MRIGIDARMIEHSGIGTYTRNIISFLPRISSHEYVLFGNVEKLKQYGLKTVAADFPIYGIKEQILFPGIIASSGVDLFHSIHYNIPLLYRGPMVVTICDLIHLIYPGFLPSRAAFYYAKYMLKSAVKRAKRILTISQKSKEDIKMLLNTDESKISVIYPGVNAEFAPSRELSGSQKRAFGKYILYVGAIREHKNILALIEAFHTIKMKFNAEHKLLLVGKGKYDYLNKVGNLIAKYNINDSVLILDNVGRDELRSFYCGAELFVLPSLYEGFGLPILEAMACGCPVIASNSASIPEVAGESALMFDPDDTQMMAQLMYKVLSDKALSENLIMSGLKRASIFPWKKTAEGIAGVYDQVLANPKS